LIKFRPLFRSVRNSTQIIAATDGGLAGQHAQAFLPTAPVLGVVVGDLEMAFGDNDRCWLSFT
jgi:hypothetical protein